MPLEFMYASPSKLSTIARTPSPLARAYASISSVLAGGRDVTGDVDHARVARRARGPRTAQASAIRMKSARRVISKIVR